MAKIVFMGTPEFAVNSLRALIQHHEVIGVVTQPDRPAGRGNEVKMSPIKQVALEHHIPVFQPEKIRKPEAIDQLAQWHADAYVVAAFGQILPQRLLDIPHFGSINVHASLLPRWRGAAPIHACIRAGDSETGVTIMKMDAGLDTGPMLMHRAIPIAPDETGQSLHDKLAQLGADLLIEALPKYFSGEISPIPQPEEGVIFAPQIQKEEGHIQWSDPAISIERLMRAFTPWPGTYTFWDGKQLKIHAGHIGDGRAPIGKVMVVGEDNRIAIGTGDGLFYPTEVQLEGKKRTSITDFIRGYTSFAGAVLG
ncbi:MAG: methionyl-tRNA formyltransferase [Anaerolineae bacterium]|nr:methionyl-tRNA formyltransferase [Anaerolineae bacterium]